MTVLCSSPYCSELHKAQFQWTHGLVQAIKEQYEADGGGILTVDLLSPDKKGWRRNRNTAARAKLRTGVVLKTTRGGAEVGEVSACQRRTAGYKADENAAAGIGPLQTINISHEKLERVIQSAKALRIEPSTKVPEDIKEFFPVGNDMLAAAVSIVCCC